MWHQQCEVQSSASAVKDTMWARDKQVHNRVSKLAINNSFLQEGTGGAGTINCGYVLQRV